ncbi:effector-associated constant component EACC1 [Pseudonocardia acaciae]|uniref:effector-associated constant component EACC1 n=1 Tax=Pseudonocardia acaciae TaxID=551276 RepID=UPI000687D2D4|nr:hypothetical protein [Pseudonocardia acaciae]
MTPEKQAGAATTTVRVVLHADPELGTEDGERLTRRLRAELDDLDVESVEMARVGDAPAGAKGDPVTVGALLVALSVSGGVFPSVIATLRDWLERQSGRHRVSVTVDGDTIELDRATSEQQRALVGAFVRRHAAS